MNLPRCRRRVLWAEVERFLVSSLSASVVVAEWHVAGFATSDGPVTQPVGDVTAPRETAQLHAIPADPTLVRFASWLFEEESLREV